MLSNRNQALLFSVVLALGFAALPAFAETDAAHPDTSSAGNRSRSHYSLAIQPVGLGEGVQSGVIGEYFRTPDDHLGLRYEHGQELEDMFGDYQAHADWLAFTAKSFLRNSFYVEFDLALHRREVFRRSLMNWNASTGDYVTHESRYTRSDAGVMVGIGNEWQWSRFLIGCEWAGVYVPITSSSVRGEKKEIRKDGTVELLSMDKKENEASTSFRALNFHIGMAF